MRKLPKSEPGHKERFDAVLKSAVQRKADNYICAHCGKTLVTPKGEMPGHITRLDDGRGFHLGCWWYMPEPERMDYMRGVE